MDFSCNVIFSDEDLKELQPSEVFLWKGPVENVQEAGHSSDASLASAHSPGHVDSVSDSGRAQRQIRRAHGAQHAPTATGTAGNGHQSALADAEERPIH